MSEQARPHQELSRHCRTWGIFWIASGLVTAFWLAGLVIPSIWPEAVKARAGELGVSVEAINALFAGLAYAGVIVALLNQHRELRLQRRELRLQRRELELQRKQMEFNRQELARTAGAQEMSEQALRKQAEILELTARVSAAAAVTQARAETDKWTAVSIRDNPSYPRATLYKSRQLSEIFLFEMLAKRDTVDAPSGYEHFTGKPYLCKFMNDIQTKWWHAKQHEDTQAQIRILSDIGDELHIFLDQPLQIEIIILDYLKSYYYSIIEYENKAKLIDGFAEIAEAVDASIANPTPPFHYW